MKLTDAVMKDITGQTIAVNTSDNQRFIGKVVNVDAYNLKLVSAGAVGSTVGILNKDRVNIVSCDVITSITILEQ